VRLKIKIKKGSPAPGGKLIWVNPKKNPGSEKKYKNK
jgi:hypothetical protein